VSTVLVAIHTDGAVWDTEEIIRKAKSSSHRIFAIGVGSAPAESLLQELAEKTNGACELIAPKENIEKPIVRMFNRLRLPRPKDIVIQWDHIEQPLWTTGADRTIFYGNTSHIFAGFLTPPTSPPILSYQISQDVTRVKVQANSISHSTNKNIPRLGASERLSSESDEYKLALALTYQLITDQTNCILIHVRSDEEKAQGLPELQKIAQMQAAGWGGFGSVYEEAYSSQIISSCRGSMTDNWTPAVLRSRGPRVSEMLCSSNEFYERPAFLRKDVASLDMLKPSFEKITKKSDVKPNLLHKYLKKEVKPISPSDVIKIANQEIKVPQDITSFIELINKQKMAPELLQVVGNLINKQGVRDAWILILAWLIIRLDEKVTWNKLTKDAIEELTNQLDRSKLDDGLQLLTLEMFEVTKDYWW
jgi:Ca-activated chloride channel family protein